MSRTARLLLATVTATFVCYYGLHSPFTPDAVNEAMRQNVWVLAITGIEWLFVFGMSLRIMQIARPR